MIVAEIIILIYFFQEGYISSFNLSFSIDLIKLPSNAGLSTSLAYDSDY